MASPAHGEHLWLWERLPRQLDTEQFVAEQRHVMYPPRCLFKEVTQIVEESVGGILNSKTKTYSNLYVNLILKNIIQNSRLLITNLQSTYFLACVL